MADATILVVDDEPAVVSTVRAYLEREGYTVHTAADGPAALRAAHACRPDLIVLDIMLPGLDGLEVLRCLRQESPVYVLLLTARSDETDKIVGLTVGADDYLTKPFSPRELVARVKAVLRRGRGGSLEEPALTCGDLRIDSSARQAWKGEAPLDLTPIEFSILHVLARHASRVLSREQIIEQVWGNDYYGDDRVVDVHIGRIRKKIEDDPERPERLVTVRGAGYRLEAGHP
ncbi:MAG TPA: response regulator transcription factor [Anaerolineae bacterium]|nr:response regulator transcription factor [Anaerolineae bacterium]HPL26714.1 response regulator transcription factor [Anaerolineae bacterium]